MQDVIGSLIAFTDKPGILARIMPIRDYTVFKYKRLGNELYRFDLWYYFAFCKLSYWPAPIFGTISTREDGEGGCKIVINPLRAYTTASYICIPLYIAICYIIFVSALVSRDAAWVPLSIIAGCFGTIILVRFISTRKKWLSDNVLLDIIDRAANARRQQFK